MTCLVIWPLHSCVAVVYLLAMPSISSYNMYDENVCLTVYSTVNVQI